MKIVGGEARVIFWPELYIVITFHPVVFGHPHYHFLRGQGGKMIFTCGTGLFGASGVFFFFFSSLSLSFFLFCFSMKKKERRRGGGWLDGWMDE